MNGAREEKSPLAIDDERLPIVRDTAMCELKRNGEHCAEKNPLERF